MKIKSYVSEVISKINKLPPILVSFEHGDLKPGEVTDLRCAVLQKKTVDKQRVVAVATGHLQHRNKAASDTGVTTTFIAVHNKKTNKVRLIETECFMLSPAIAKKDVAASSDVVDAGLRHAQLNKSFGSKVAKRRQEQLERTKIHTDNLEGQLAEVTQTVEVAEEDLNFSKEGLDTLKSLLPPFNPEATTVDKVYELANILSPDELDSLDVTCDEVMADPSNYEKHSPSKLFLSCLPAALVSKDRARLKALLYADCVAKFLGVTTNHLSKKDLVLCPYSIHISNNILDNFTTKTGKKRNRSVMQRDKALCYVIVLGLLAGGFQLNLRPVTESLHRVGLEKLQDLRRFVGAVPAAEPNTIMLKLPLPSVRDTQRRARPTKRRM